MLNQRKVAALAIVTSCLAASAASAGVPVWPGSIIGTWSGLSNLSPIVLTVSTQTAGGKCQSISGTVKEVADGSSGNMLGYYCPSSGAVEFLRFPTKSNVAFQAYTANLSQSDAPKSVGGVFIAGTFSQYSLLYGPLGQYSVSLSKYKSPLAR